MKRSVIFLIMFLFVITAVSALQVTPLPVRQHVFSGEDVQYNLRMVNDEGGPRMVTVRSIDLNFILKGDKIYIPLESGETKNILVTFEQLGSGLRPGRYALSVIATTQISRVEKFLPAEVITEDKLFEVEITGAASLEPGKNNIATISIINKYNLPFQGMQVETKSPFLNVRRIVDLTPEARTNLEEELIIPKNTVEGEHQVQVKLSLGNKAYYDKEVPVTIGGREDTREIQQALEGFLWSGMRITKSNNGNTIEEQKLAQSFSSFDYLFTSFSPEPTKIEETPSGKTATWEYTLQPGESKSIQYTTSYRMPVFLVFLALLAISGYIIFRQRNVIDVEKRVITVKTLEGKVKNLKILITVKNRSAFAVNKVNIFDKIPDQLGTPAEYGLLKPITMKKAEDGTRLLWSLPGLKGRSEKTITYRVDVNSMKYNVLPAAVVKYRLHARNVVARSAPVSIVRS